MTLTDAAETKREEEGELKVNREKEEKDSDSPRNTSDLEEGLEVVEEDPYTRWSREYTFSIPPSRGRKGGEEKLRARSILCFLPTGGRSISLPQPAEPVSLLQTCTRPFQLGGKLSLPTPSPSLLSWLVSFILSFLPFSPVPTVLRRCYL